MVAFGVLAVFMILSILFKSHTRNDYSRIETGPSEWELEHFSVTQFIHNDECNCYYAMYVHTLNHDLED